MKLTSNLPVGCNFPGFNFNPGVDFYLTGKGSNLLNMQKYCQDFFEIDSMEKEQGDIEKNFSACFGAIKIIKDGWETEAIPEIKVKSIEKMGFLSKFFRNH